MHVGTDTTSKESQQSVLATLEPCTAQLKQKIERLTQLASPLLLPSAPRPGTGVVLCRHRLHSGWRVFILPFLALFRLPLSSVLPATSFPERETVSRCVVMQENTADSLGLFRTAVDQRCSHRDFLAIVD